MCGIAGILDADLRRAPQRAREVNAMTDALRHRGPDDAGVWQEGPMTLGHRRLSILDLTAAGHQPMVHEGGRFVMSFNGEIYNYVELRQELEALGERFRSATDSEVLLAAFARWGDAALAKFNGMWAVAIWDRETRELFLARDRAGKKPLQYATLDDGAFAFASEIRPLLALGLRVSIDPQAAFDFVTQGTYGHLAERGFLQGMLQLPAGHLLRVRPGEAPSVRRYWDLPIIPLKDRPPYDEAFRTKFRDLLTSAIALRLRSDVPVGATLSGGLDSSAIVLLMERLTNGAPVHLFTSLYPGAPHDETPYFEAVVRRLKKPIVHRAVPQPDAWREDLVRALEHQEEPFGDTSILAHSVLMREARRQGVPVVLSGQGGDELLLGYPSMVNAYLGALLGAGRLTTAVRELWTWSPTVGIPPLQALRNVLGAALPLRHRDRLRQRYVARMAVAVTPEIRRAVSLRRFADEEGRDAFGSYLAQVFKRWAIPHLTHYDDRNAMTYAVESRMPFLDVRLIEMMFAARPEALFAGGLTKRVLRESLAGVLPDEIRLRRDKVGFYTPLGGWLSSHSGWVTEVTARDRLEATGVVNAPWYAARREALFAGQSSAALDVWRGFILQLWAERFGVSASAEPRPADGRAA